MSFKTKIKRTIQKLRYGPRATSEDYVQFLKAQGCQIGKGTFFFDPRTCSIDAVRPDYIRIGEYCKFTSHFTLLAHDYSFSCLLHTHGELLPPGGAQTQIGNNCFVGMNTTVLMGVTIGDNVIIGANSLVTHDIPSNCVAGGVPAKVLMTLDEYYARRKERFDQDVQRNVRHLLEQKGRQPTTKELGLYAMQYLERTPENWETYFAHYGLSGNNQEEFKRAFFDSQPRYADKDAFLKAVLDSDHSKGGAVDA